MRQIKCPNCGGNLIPQPEGHYVCDYCHSVSEGAGSDLNEEDIIDLDNANYRRKQYDFDEAFSLCQKVLRRNPMNAEANRCALLARYQIVYLKNAKGEYTATFLDPETESPITQSPYYRNLPERLKRELDKAEAIRQRVVRNAKDIPQYDVFISYKSGGEEAEWARECYKMLTKQQEGKRYNVFYDEVSLGAKQAGWEPHIYAALKSAKCMILFSSSLDNMNSTWVQNEWKRFIYLQRSDPKKEIIVVGKNIEPYDLPDPAMRDEQMLTVGVDPWQNHVKARVREICDDSNISELLKNGESYLLVGKFAKASIVFRRVLGLDPNCAAAYWGLLRCRLKAFDDYDIVKCRKRLDKIDEFYKARTLAEAENDEELKQRIRKVQNAQITKDAAPFDRNNYENYRKKTKGRRRLKKTAIVLGVLAFAAMGVYGYWGYTHPLEYTLEAETAGSTSATLSGTSSIFRLVTRGDLNIDKYGNYSVVAIGDGALQNGKFKTAKLAKSVKTIGKNAFSQNNKLTKVTCLGTSIKIGDYAFANCTSLSSIEFGGASSEAAATAVIYSPGGSISIGTNAFENCTSLESITLSGLTALGSNAFRGCTNLKEVYIDAGRNLKIEMGAFNSVSDSLVVRIPTVEEELYESLVREYANVKFEGYTRDRVEEADYFIGKIGEVTLDSLPAIEKAEQLYNALTQEERGKISNYDVLRDARAIYTAVVAINRIGTVTLQSEAAITAAEDSFKGLNESQKARVANREALTDARAVFDVMKCISEIGTVNAQSKGAIERAEEEYDGLTDKQKGMVSNYTVLRDARDTYDVRIVMDLIERIGTVTENSGSLIEQAEAAFNALSPTLRPRVTNSALLQEARLIYNVEAAIAKINVITLDSMASIQATENLYYGLAEELRGKVTNYASLVSARKIYSVVEKIAGIGDLIWGQEAPITQAEAAFGDLTVAEQGRVGNQKDLTDARAAYDVMKLIAALGSASSNRAQIEEAERAYGSLTSVQRGKVSNYTVLQSAIDNLKIMDVEALITAIGSVTLSSDSKIEAAEAAYSSLTAAQKERVKNYSVLLDARHVYDLLVVIDGLGSVTVGSGTQYSYDTLTSASASKLGQSAFRNSIDSLTFTGIKAIQESVWTAVFSKLDLVRYDLTSVTAPAAFTVPSGELTYVLVGDTSKKYTMKVTAQAGSAVHVGFDNFVLEYGTLPIDLSNANEAYLSFYGNCSVTATDSGADAMKTKGLHIVLANNAKATITAANGAAGANGGTGLTASDLALNCKGQGSLIITGGNGGNGNRGQDGCPGGGGIRAQRITISSSLNIKIVGGDGGKAGDCLTSYDPHSYAEWENTARSGSDGFAGGLGGNAIEGTIFNANGSFTLECIGGSGGAGSNGGDGEGSDSNGNPKGGHGGNGGNGGNGGSALLLSGAFNLTYPSTSIQAVAGRGGNGGNGGQGGHAKNEDRRDDGGDGGNGGKGGNSGYCFVFSGGTSTAKGLSAIAAAGGDGGKGGAGGEAWPDMSVVPKCGNGGNGGKGGDSNITAQTGLSGLKITYSNGGSGGDGGNSGNSVKATALFWKDTAAGRSGNGGRGGDIVVEGQIYRNGADGAAGSSSRSSSYAGALGGKGGVGASV